MIGAQTKKNDAVHAYALTAQTPAASAALWDCELRGNMALTRKSSIIAEDTVHFWKSRVFMSKKLVSIRFGGVYLNFTFSCLFGYLTGLATAAGVSDSETIT